MTDGEKMVWAAVFAAARERFRTGEVASYTSVQTPDGVRTQRESPIDAAMREADDAVRELRLRAAASPFRFVGSVCS